MCSLRKVRKTIASFCAVTQWQTFSMGDKNIQIEVGALPTFAVQAEPWTYYLLRTTSVSGFISLHPSGWFFVQTLAFEER